MRISPVDKSKDMKGGSREATFPNMCGGGFEFAGNLGGGRGATKSANNELARTITQQRRPSSGFKQGKCIARGGCAAASAAAGAAVH